MASIAKVHLVMLFICLMGDNSNAMTEYILRRNLEHIEDNILNRLEELENKISSLTVKLLEPQLTKIDEKLMNIDEKIMNFDEKIMNIDKRMMSNEENACTTTATNVTENKISNNSSSSSLSSSSSSSNNNCNDILNSGDNESGVRFISPFVGNFSANEPTVEVYCDQHYQGGGWTVIQSRENLDVREEFFRNWSDYESGFGDRNGEYWLGLKAIHSLTASTPMELMVRLEAFSGYEAYANYKLFHVGGSHENYQLTLGGYEVPSGSNAAGDSLEYANGKMFSTKDRDNDGNAGNCAKHEKGGWWYKACGRSNLNGPANGRSSQSIYWYDFRSGFVPLRRSVMMVRPLN